MMLLIDACFKSKFKHGCEVWDDFNNKNRATVNTLIPNIIKRIMQIPRSTPSNAVLHDFGVVDLEWDVKIERVLLAADVILMDEKRIVKQLFIKMMDKKVPGFCVQVIEDLRSLEIASLDEVNKCPDKREMLKKKVVGLQRRLLLERMVKASKTDRLLLHFSFDGRIKKYLTMLPFQEARIVFMFRARMFPTKVNFPNRWTSSLLCTYCCSSDTDEHIFRCCGYEDLCDDSVKCEIFFKLECSIE